MGLNSVEFYGIPRVRIPWKSRNFGNLKFHESPKVLSFPPDIFGEDCHQQLRSLEAHAHVAGALRTLRPRQVDKRHAPQLFLAAAPAALLSATVAGLLRGLCIQPQLVQRDLQAEVAVVGSRWSLGYGT